MAPVGPTGAVTPQACARRVGNDATTTAATAVAAARRQARFIVCKVGGLGQRKQDVSARRSRERVGRESAPTRERYDERMPTQALVKGGAIREFLLWYEKRHGRMHHRAILERIDDAARLDLDADRPALGILASTWYPSAVLFPILDELSRGLSPTERTALAAEGTRAVVRVATKGIYQTLFRTVASPRLYARYIQRAWSFLHSTGKRTIELREEGLALSTVAEWPGHHPMLCEITTETMRCLFEAMGCTDVSVDRIACVSDGSRDCRAWVRYREP